MEIIFKPIGWVRTSVPDDETPHFYAVSDIEGTLEILDEYKGGLADLQAGQRIVVLFHFDRSPEFTPDLVRQVPRKRKDLRGIFSICSPVRPNAIGMSVVEVVQIQEGKIKVRGLDMFDGTPILDIKPHAPMEQGK